MDEEEMENERRMGRFLSGEIDPMADTAKKVTKRGERSGEPMRSCADKNPMGFTNEDQSRILWRELRERMGYKPPRRGLCSRFFGWLGEKLTALADWASHKPRHRTTIEFTTSSSFLEACWEMIRATDPKSIALREGEGIEEGTRRIVAEHIVRYERAHGMPMRLHGETETEMAGRMMERLLHPRANKEEVAGKRLDPGDPMLDSIRRERMTKLFRKKDLSAGEKEELADLIRRSGQVIVLKGEEDGVDHPERQ